MYGRSRIRRKPMRFYGNGVVWDAENNKRLCKFSRAARGEQGVLETDDPRICAELVRRGYAADPELPVVNIPSVQLDDSKPMPEDIAVTNASENAEVKIAKPDFEGAADSSEADLPKPRPFVNADMKADKLREIGRGLGLKFPVGTTKVDMAKAINEAKK
jgi:hypothetical protein